MTFLYDNQDYNLRLDFKLAKWRRYIYIVTGNLVIKMLKFTHLSVRPPSVHPSIRVSVRRLSHFPKLCFAGDMHSSECCHYFCPSNSSRAFGQICDWSNLYCITPDNNV